MTAKMDWRRPQDATKVAKSCQQPLLRTIAAGGCWCGNPTGHTWPGAKDGAPHPR